MSEYFKKRQHLLTIHSNGSDGFVKKIDLSSATELSDQKTEIKEEKLKYEKKEISSEDIVNPKNIDSLLLFAIGFFSFYFSVEFFYRLPNLYFNLFFYGGITVMFMSVVWYLITKKRRQNVQKDG